MGRRIARTGRAIVTLGTVVMSGAATHEYAWAGGFFLPQQSVKGVGRAFVAGSAVADDASTIFTNPAGMTRLPAAEIAVGASLLSLDLKVSNRGSSASIPAPPVTVPLSQRGADDAIDPAVVPNVYVAYPVMERELWLGFGLGAPFGISVDYPNDWFGRYDSVSARLLTLNLSPAVAWQPHEAVSIGAGIDIQYADTRLDAALPNTFPLLPVFAPSTDGLSEMEGDNWAVGFNVGVLVRPVPSTRIGVHYRSAISHDIEGTTRLSGLPGPLAASNATLATTTELNLPDIVSVGIVHELGPDLRILGEVQWFGWSRLEELRFEFGDGSAQVRPANYRDTWTAGIALEYALDENWTLRSGFRYDQTPTRDAYRDTIVPDGDTYWLGVGASYRTPAGFDLDVSYAHTFFVDSDIDVTRTVYAGTPIPGSFNVRARAENRGETVSLNLRWQF